MVQLLQQHARVHGIPCAHVICGHIETKQKFQASAFSKQCAPYHEDHTNSLEPGVLDTLPPFGILKTQARKRLHQNAIKRQPSGFMRHEHTADVAVAALRYTFTIA